MTLRDLPLSHRVAWGVLVLGTALRVYVAFRAWLPSALWFQDVAVYREMVAGILGGRLGADAWIWTPGYPLVAAPFAYLMGPERALVLASLVGGVAAPALLLAAGRRSASPRAAAIAAITLTLLPEMVRASARPLSEAVAVALLVGAGVAAGACLRGGGARTAAVGGAAGALAVLARPEIAFAIAAFALLLWRTPRRAAAYAAGAVVLLAPFVLALHSASGAWGLSLKPQLNAMKNIVYEKEDSYIAKRLAWGRYEAAELRDTEGNWLPRRIAERGHVGAYVASTAWLDNVKSGLRRSSAEMTALFVAGLAGLFVLARRRRDELALVVAALLPLLAAAFFVQILGRFLLVGAPALAWGAGALLDAGLARFDRRPALAWIVGATVVTAALVASAVVSTSSIVAGRLTELAPEIELLGRAGKVERAMAATRAWLALEPRNAQVRLLYAEILENSGHAEAAGEAIDEAVGLGAPKVEKAQWLLRQGNVKAARGVLDEAGEAEQKTFGYWSARAQIAGSERQWQDLGRAAERMLAIDKTSALAHFDMGVALSQLGDDGGARKHLNAVIQSGDAANAERAKKVLEYLAKREAAQR
ncbi:MAG: hypothetical protein U0167_17295 [bacterium]